MKSFILKLCLVAAMLSIGVAIAACTPQEQAIAVTADTWAKRVCNLIEQTPPAAASTLPSNVTVDVQVTPSVAIAIVATYPTDTADAGPDAPMPKPAISAMKMPLPQSSEAGVP